MHSLATEDLIESWRSVKVNTPTNRSNHRGVPRTKIERTTSLRLIHAYDVEDPARLRRPELGTSAIERREEQHFEAMDIGSNEREREGQPFGGEQSLLYIEGVPPPPLFIGGGEPPWRRGQP